MSLFQPWTHLPAETLKTPPAKAVLLSLIAECDHPPAIEMFDGPPVLPWGFVPDAAVIGNLREQERTLSSNLTILVNGRLYSFSAYPVLVGQRVLFRPVAGGTSIAWLNAHELTRSTSASPSRLRIAHRTGLPENTDTHSGSATMPSAAHCPGHPGIYSILPRRHMPGRRTGNGYGAGAASTCLEIIVQPQADPHNLYTYK